MAELADIQQTVYPEEVTRQMHIMVQARESLQANVLTTLLRHQLADQPLDTPVAVKKT